MSDPVLVALIVSASTVIQAVIAARNHTDTKAAVQAVDNKVADTHNAINGRMDELVKASKAQGAQDQRDETRQDAKDAKVAKENP